MYRAKRVKVTHSLPIRPLDDELVLENDEVALAFLVCHERLELRAERVQEVPSAGLHLLGREEPDPAHARNDACRLRLIGERANLLDLGDQGANMKVSASTKGI